MAGAVYFVQECPTCGRHLQVRVEYLGKKVACRHCGGRFEASHVDDDDAALGESTLLKRADELIEAATQSTIAHRSQMPSS